MELTTFNHKRFRAALLLMDHSFQDAADAADVTYQHLRYVVLGERRASKAVLTRLRQYFGDAYWSWITQETDPFMARAASPLPAVD